MDSYQMCNCDVYRSMKEPATTKDGKFKYLCPECGGIHLIFDAHAGSVSCHDCGKFDTYGGERDITECLVPVGT